MSDGRSFKCPECGEVFSRREGYQRKKHLSEVHQLTLLWTCSAEECTYRTTSRRYHDHHKHWVNRHGGQPLDPRPLLVPEEGDGSPGDGGRVTRAASAGSPSAEPEKRRRKRSPRRDIRRVCTRSSAERPSSRCRGTSPPPSSRRKQAERGSSQSSSTSRGRRSTRHGRQHGSRSQASTRSPPSSRESSRPLTPCRSLTPPERAPLQMTRIPKASRPTSSRPLRSEPSAALGKPPSTTPPRSPATPLLQQPTTPPAMSRATPCSIRGWRPGKSPRAAPSAALGRPLTPSPQDVSVTEETAPAISVSPDAVAMIEDAEGDPIAIDLHPAFGDLTLDESVEIVEPQDPVTFAQVRTYLEFTASEEERTIVREQLGREGAERTVTRNRRVQADIRPLHRDQGSQVRFPPEITLLPGGGVRVSSPDLLFHLGGEHTGQ